MSQLHWPTFACKCISYILVQGLTLIYLCRITNRFLTFTDGHTHTDGLILLPRLPMRKVIIQAAAGSRELDQRFLVVYLCRIISNISNMTDSFTAFPLSFLPPASSRLNLLPSSTNQKSHEKGSRNFSIFKCLSLILRFIRDFLGPQDPEGSTCTSLILIKPGTMDWVQGRIKMYSVSCITRKSLLKISRGLKGRAKRIDQIMCFRVLIGLSEHVASTTR